MPEGILLHLTSICYYIVGSKERAESIKQWLDSFGTNAWCNAFLKPKTYW